MRIVAWNVLQGGGVRVAGVVEVLRVLDGDVLVIGEHRAGNGLSDALRHEGWVHQAGDPDPESGHAAVLVASREPLGAAGVTYADALDGHRFVDVRADGWRIGAAYVPGYPGREKTQKRRFWDFVVDEWAAVAAEEPSMLIGDLNTGRHRIDEVGKTLVCSEHMLAMFGAGWNDAWEQLHGLDPKPPATWWSNAGNGFRLDHAVLSPASPAPLSIAHPPVVGDATICGPTLPAGTKQVSDHLPLVLELPG